MSWSRSGKYLKVNPVMGEKVNILLVDDTPANLLALEAVLSDLGQNLVTAHSGRDALKHLLRQDFAVVLLDVNMPEMDGFETAALIRQRPRSEYTPIIFVTAHDATETGKARGYNLGAVDYIYAPVVPEILKAKVASFVELSKIQLLHKRAEARAQQEATRAKTLTHIATRLNTHLDLNTVLSTVCEATAQTLASSAALVALSDQKSQTFAIVCDYGLPPDFRQQMPTLPAFIYEENTGQGGQVRIIPDIHTLSGFDEVDLLTTFDIYTSVTALMLRDSVTIGCLTIFTTQETRHFSDNDLIFLQGLADQATLAITNAKLFSEVQNSRKRLQQLARQLVFVQEQGRRSLSRELHDQVGQVLIALHINMKLIINDLPAELDSLRTRLDDAFNLIGTVTEDIRTIAHSLRPPVLDGIDLNTHLETLCQDFTHYTRLAIDYRGADVAPLPEAITISFYRFLQEALTNVAKHAQAKQVQVRLNQKNGEVTLTVEDDGMGFNTADENQRNGIGLVGMQERFEMLGGELGIESQPGQGTCLVATVPLKQA